MRMQFFAIPAFDPGNAAVELNQFLASHRVVAIDRQLVADGPGSAWAVCVRYQQGEAVAAGEQGGGRKRVDYRELLSDDDFQVFTRLRDWRKEVAQREGGPVYNVFTNEQLAAIVQNKVRKKRELATLGGVGETRIKKYGSALLDCLRAIDRELSPAPEPKDAT